MTDDFAVDGARPIPEIDPSRPHQARVWNYWVGGKDHFAADRESAAQVMKVFPGIVDVARQSRGFLKRAAANPYTNRSPQEIAAFLEDVDLLPPGVVSTSLWRPNAQEVGGPPAEVAAYCGVGRKPAMV